MALLVVETKIKSGIQRCFDASRSIDLHLASTAHTNERVFSGKKSGLCEKGDIIVWEATHLGVKQKFTSEITKMEAPFYFEDKMLKGAFKSFRHEHYFEEDNGIVLMTDHLDYRVPLGVLGKIFDAVYLKNYMRKFLEHRNQVIKKHCEEKQIHPTP